MRRRRGDGWLFGVLLLLLTVFALARTERTFGGGGPAGPVALPPLRVGMDPSFVPFEFYTGPDTPAQGYDVDLAEEIARRMGREAAIIPTSYDGLADGLRTGKLEVVISAFPYDPRLTEDLRFTGAYFNAGPVLVVRTGQPAPETVKRLAVELGSSGDVAARRLKPAPASIARLPTPEDVIGVVKAGQVDAGLLDMVTALQAGPEVTPVGLPIADEFYVIAVRKDNDATFTGVNFILEALRREGFLDALAVKWMGRAAPRE